MGIASVGFDSDANRIANEAPAWLGGLVYAYGALRALVAWRPARFEIELDPPGERKAFTALHDRRRNSKAYGGGMRAAPGALLDDGLLEVIVLESVSKFSVRHDESCRRCSRARTSSSRGARLPGGRSRDRCDRPFTMYADGDPIGELPLRVRALRGAVRC